MGKLQKLIQLVLSGQSDTNIGFNELCNLLIKFGFTQRVKGSHHIFHKTGVDEIINLQPKGGNTKAYQVKQIRDLMVKYRLMLEGENDE